MRMPIRRRALATGGALLACAGGAAGLATGTRAATTTSDLAISASRLAGATSTQQGLDAVFTATLTNKGPDASNVGDVRFTVSGGSVVNYVCVLPSNHFMIFPDSPNCETGALKPGQSAHDAIIVSPTAAPGGKVTVRACAVDMAPGTDPVASNNCQTVSMTVE
jgi:Domain of unknown function DUF11